MKRSALMMGLVVFLVVVLAAGVLFAQKPGRKGEPVGRLPDLIVRDIELVKDCWIKVTLQNIGAGGVPASIYSGNYSAVQMYKGNQPHGGMVLRVFDPNGLLKTPGASVSNVWFYGSPGLNLDPGTHAIKVIVDNDHAVTESNENNNSRTERLTCKPPVGKCCIAGTYKGISEDDPKCPVGPESGKFTLILKQTDCGSPVLGDILDPATGAVTSRLKGTVTPGPGKCCTIEGKVKGMPGTDDAACLHDVEATLCKNKLGKWYATDGTYTDLSGSCCSGTFKLQQQ
jgi:hypothetical protein